MHKHFHCPAGHNWTVSFEGPSTLPLESISCPICGGLAETLTGEPGLQNDTEAPPPSESLPELPGYALVEVLGRGGMGVVFRARQVGLDRTVAVKMIRDELLAGPVERLRFRVEAEAAARIQHENIVRIHEVGEHQGRPFISMEFVPGGTLSRKLAGAPQLPRAAAEMIETLARAIHVAHECKIVHRDLKPGNILIAPDGTPKIVDFGLAKRLEPGPGLTHTGIIMGSPSYMAPEQAAGKSQNVGPAADIYALGAILYKMLTGRPPFRAVTTLDTLNQIIKDEPVSPTKLQSRIPFDLEVICLKCLHKQPDRRYASARELADDLNRYLTGRPIVARPSGWPERAWRWCRRQPALAGTLGLAFLAVAAGSVLAVVLAVTQTRAADDLKHKQAETLEALVLANQRLDQLNRANSVLISIFKDLDARGSTRRNRTLEAALGERLVEAGKRLGDDAAGDPLAAADLQDALGTTLSELGYPRDAVPLHGQSSAVRERVLGPEHPKTLDALNNLAIDYILSDQFALAAPLLELLVERMKAVYGADDENTLDALNNLAVTYRDSGNPEKARPIHEEILAKVTAKFGPDDERTHSTMHNLASVYQDLKLLDRAIPLYQKALDGRTARFGADHPTVLQNKKNLAMALLENGDTAKAGEFLGDVVQRLTKERGPDHPETLIAASAYGEALLRQKVYAEAERVLRDCFHRSEKKAPDAWTTFHVQTLLGAAVLGQGRYDDAEPFLLAGQKGLAESMKTHANLVRPRLRDAASRLVELYEAWGKPAEAARWRDAARAP